MVFYHKGLRVCKTPLPFPPTASAHPMPLCSRWYPRLTSACPPRTAHPGEHPTRACPRRPTPPGMDRTGGWGRAAGAAGGGRHHRCSLPSRSACTAPFRARKVDQYAIIAAAAYRRLHHMQKPEQACSSALIRDRITIYLAGEGHVPLHEGALRIIYFVAIYSEINPQGGV
jgi:hypothetical protein